jgi:hypothetical protein
MPTSLESVVTKYLRSSSPAQRTREEYSTTLRKWSRWSGAVPLEGLGRKEIREFLDWVHEDAGSRGNMAAAKESMRRNAEDCGDLLFAKVLTSVSIAKLLSWQG